MANLPRGYKSTLIVEVPNKGPLHFLTIAHYRLVKNRQEHLWAPGSTAWKDYAKVSESTIRRAQREGYLTKRTKQGIQALTKKGWRRF